MPFHRTLRRLQICGVSVLQEHVKAKRLEPIQFDTVSPEKLASLLEGFYAGAKTRYGEKYWRNSLLAARGAINRHIQNFQAEMNLFSGMAFKKANQILDEV